jgi:hypothetical protein
MTHQPDLFRPMCGQLQARQNTLFPLAGPRESEERCGECGANLVETTSGFWTCPRGHGKLLVKGEESGS